METLNRKVMPALCWSGDLPRAALRRETLHNGDSLTLLQGGQESAVLLWVCFPLGHGIDMALLESVAAFELMLRGTARSGAAEVSERFDAQGTNVQSFGGNDFVGLRMLCTTAAFRESLELLLECLTQPLYAQEVFTAWRDRIAEGLEVAAQTPDFVARRALWGALLSEAHRYQRMATPATARKLHREDVVRYYRESVSGCSCHVFACGPEGDEWAATLREVLMRRDSGRRVAVVRAPLVPAGERRTVINASVQRQQASVHLGCVLPNAGHEGCLDLKILTSLLGGYMGSRLMQKLREEKGYTYGVHAAVRYWLDGGVLEVSSEVGNKYVAECVKDIKGEFARLREELVGEEELARLRSYLYGRLLQNCDGVYETLSVRMTYELNGGYGANYLERYARAVGSVTSERLRLAAREWLREERFTLSVAGDADEFSDVRW